MKIRACFSFSLVLMITVMHFGCNDSSTPIESSLVPPTKAGSSTPEAARSLGVVSPEDSSSLISPNMGQPLEIRSPTTARYSIGERVARLDTPITAVGETSNVQGRITFDSEGAISPGSNIKVDATTLRSDENKRDNWVRRNGGLGQEVSIELKSVQGLPWPLPESGSFDFRLIGEMTISGITKPTIWKTSADFSTSSVIGVAKTSVTWDEFDLSKPRLPFIISMDDVIDLSISFETTR